MPHTDSSASPWPSPARTRVRAPAALALATLLPLASLAVAQDAPAPPPVSRGRDRVTASVGQAGASLELANGAKLLIPAGLPIGQSRTVTFSVSRNRVRPASVAAGFIVQGPTVAFDTPLNATSNPVVLSLSARRLTQRPGMHLVVAVEQAGVCTPQNHDHLPNGLCSTWDVLDASYDESTGLIQASIPTPGGFRLQLGWMPLPS